MKVLISVLTMDEEPYISLENKIRETWLLDAKAENIDVIFYFGNVTDNPKENRLFLPINESWGTINKKTFLMFEHIKKNFEFDFLIRTNSSSYIDIKNLLNFLKDKPTNNYYSGKLGNRHNQYQFGAGSCYILSRDLLDYIVDNENLWDFHLPDDVAVAAILIDHKNIELSEGFRFECQDWHLQNHSLIDLNHYHYRCKVDNDRNKDIALLDAIHNLKNNTYKLNSITDDYDFEIKFEKPHNTKWSITEVFNNFYNDFSQKNKVKYIIPINKNEPGGPDSPHIMTIRNKNTNKYIIVSYWDRAEELLNNDLGWDTKNLVGLITSAGVYNNIQTIPFSYLTYSSEFDKLAQNRLLYNDKTKEDLIFRGYLYGQRLDLSKLGIFNITDKKVFPNSNYYKELTESKICLSLNGAGEICNRDIEILSAGSVLMRPILNQKFHNELIPNFHYIGFEFNPDPIIQMNIIKNKYDEIKNNNELLEFISNNGYNWYIKNGTIEANVNILIDIFNDLNLINELSL